MVVSLASGGERHVVQKLGRQLGVQISEVEVAYGQAAEKEEQQADGRRPDAKQAHVKQQRRLSSSQPASE